MSSHLSFREPTKANIWFGEKKGCFQKPDRDVLPETVSVTELGNMEKLVEDSEETFSHPRTGSSSKFILGDRFHASTRPHKDPRQNKILRNV